MVQNGQLLAVFNSAHRVMKAENVLKSLGVTILLIPAPRALSTDCGLAICYNSDLYDSVLQSLTTKDVLPDVIYLKETDLRYKPVWSAENIKDSGD
ncbi:MAG: DUF3343 domain-containing protein [Desulfuromonadaceae bacterium]|nr:DUF3343 domain-containing protein [Desulfuromonadaceae bacterium]